MSVCPNVRLSKCPFVKMSICQNVHLWKCQLVKHVRLSKCPFVKVSICRNVQLSKCPFVNMSICQNVHLSKCPVVKMSVCRMVLLFCFYAVSIFCRACTACKAALLRRCFLGEFLRRFAFSSFCASLYPYVSAISHALY